VPATIRERAYSSPIRYAPAAPDPSSRRRPKTSARRSSPRSNGLQRSTFGSFLPGTTCIV